MLAVISICSGQTNVKAIPLICSANHIGAKAIIIISSISGEESVNDIGEIQARTVQHVRAQRAGAMEFRVGILGQGRANQFFREMMINAAVTCPVGYPAEDRAKPAPMRSAPRATSGTSTGSSGSPASSPRLYEGTTSRRGPYQVSATT